MLRRVPGLRGATAQMVTPPSGAAIRRPAREARDASKSATLSERVFYTFAWRRLKLRLIGYATGVVQHARSTSLGSRTGGIRKGARDVGPAAAKRPSATTHSIERRTSGEIGATIRAN